MTWNKKHYALKKVYNNIVNYTDFTHLCSLRLMKGIIMEQTVLLSHNAMIRIAQIQHELSAIEQGYTDMLNGNETITDRLLILSYELLDILSK